MTTLKLDIARAQATQPNKDWPQNTVGHIMNTSYVALNPKQTVREALDVIRLDAPVKDTIYFAYVLDERGHILGTVSLRQLILAHPEKTMAEIMTAKVVTCEVSEPQSVVSQLIGRYDLLAIPVINEAQEMVGIVTHDDAFDVIVEDSTEDHFKLSAIGPLPDSLKTASLAALYRMRVGWLIVLVFGNIFSGAGIAHFEEIIESMVALVFFLPLLVDSGGNAGSQSATLVVRALATGDVVARDWLKLLRKEVFVALLLGLTMAAAVSTIGLYRGGPEIALVVSLTMVLIVLVGSLIGLSLPFILNKLKLDPASASAPLITTICDGVGVLIYFNVASTLLHFPAVS